MSTAWPSATAPVCSPVRSCRSRCAASAKHKVRMCAHQIGLSWKTCPGRVGNRLLALVGEHCVMVPSAASHNWSGLYRRSAQGRGTRQK
jgi:hypothetical protein